MGVRPRLLSDETPSVYRWRTGLGVGILLVARSTERDSTFVGTCLLRATRRDSPPQEIPVWQKATPGLIIEDRKPLNAETRWWVFWSHFVKSVSRIVSSLRAGVRAMLKRFLSQERRTELKRLQGQARKRFAPLLTLVHGSFTSEQLLAEFEICLPSNFEILMVHSSFDSFLPMYKGNAKDLVRALIDFCGPNRTVVMPSFVMGGRNYDAAAYFQSKPFDIRTTPSDMGIIAEIFRRTPNVRRSLHPTCGICAFGPLANEVPPGHHLAR